MTIEEKTAVAAGVDCMACGHCAAACPVEAIRVSAMDPHCCRFETFPTDIRWRPHGRFDCTALANLMASRRSCRNFCERPVDRSILEDLVRAGITAPSGSNCQSWRFAILPDRKAVEQLGRRVGHFFRNVNRMARNKWLRLALKWIGKPQLDRYYRQHFATVEDGLAKWEHDGRDLLFHRATAVIVVSAVSSASCPAEDALLATGNVLLAAHAMGLGTCLVGFVTEAMRKDRAIRRLVGIPDHESPFAVIAVGWPDEAERYQRVADRKPPVIRYVDTPRGA